jgi:stromal interaction molecule 1
MTKILGVTNPIHRSKMSLKAMDVVLFGPPKEPSSTVKDIIFTSLLVVAITGLAYAYRQNKKSQEHLKRMMTDMEGLSKAEETLKDLQEKLILKDEKLESLELSQNQVNS